MRGGIWDAEASRELQDDCATLLDRVLPEHLREQPPDVVMLMTTAADVADHRFSAGGEALSPADPAFESRIDYRAITERVGAGGATVAWIVPPPLFPYGTDDRPSTDDTRSGVRDAIIDHLAERRGVVALDLRAWCEAEELTRDMDAGPDGIHWTPEASWRVATEWLGPALLAAATTTH